MFILARVLFFLKSKGYLLFRRGWRFRGGVCGLIAADHLHHRGAKDPGFVSPSCTVERIDGGGRGGILTLFDGDGFVDLWVERVAISGANGGDIVVGEGGVKAACHHIKAAGEFSVFAFVFPRDREGALEVIQPGEEIFGEGEVGACGELIALALKAREAFLPLTQELLTRLFGGGPVALVACSQALDQLRILTSALVRRPEDDGEDGGVQQDDDGDIRHEALAPVGGWRESSVMERESCVVNVSVFGSGFYGVGRCPGVV